LRLKRLVESIKQFNDDQIPFYISTPQADKNLLIEILGAEGYQWIADEGIVVANPKGDLQRYKDMPGGLSQQIVKAEFWRLGLSENNLCLDSDSLFIRSFKQSDFITADNIPYTVLHQNKELFQISSNRGQDKVERDLRIEAERVKTLFNRTGPNFYGAPAPFNWSAKVWQSLDWEYLQIRGMTIWDLITPQYPESLVYIEALMKYRALPILAIEPLFRVYHYEWQYFLMKHLGETQAKVAKHYLGVIYQSAWEADLNFGKSQKSLPSRLLKKIKRIGRYLQSFI